MHAPIDAFCVRYCYKVYDELFEIAVVRIAVLGARCTGSCGKAMSSQAFASVEAALASSDGSRRPSPARLAWGWMLDQTGLVQGSLAHPSVSDDGEVLWSRVALIGPQDFCILSIRQDGAVHTQLAFSDQALYDRICELGPGELAEISLVQPQLPEMTKWAARGLNAVRLWESKDGDSSFLSYEFDTGGGIYFPIEDQGAWTVVWRRS